MTPRVLRALSVLVPAAAFATSPAPIVAQVATVDAGSFTITRQGTPAGREEFSIRSTPGIDGTILKAQATVSLDGRRITPALSTDPAGAPLSYQVEVRAGDEVVERVSGQINRDRLSVRSQNATGSSAREYVIAAGALILDEDVFHQYYFVARRGLEGPLPVLSPRTNAQTVLRVSSQGPAEVTVGGRPIAATHLVLSGPGGEREIWVDAASRVLKVEIPARGLVALRDEPPR